MFRLQKIVFLVLCFAFFMTDANAARNKSLSVEEQYELGQRYLKRGYYIKAVEQFNRIRNNYRDDPLAIDSELAIADVHFKKGEWELARSAYDSFRRRYPRHSKIDYVVFQIGLTFYKKAPRFAGRDQSWTTQAVSSWSQYDDRYPGSEHSIEVSELRIECLDRLAKKELQIAEFYVRREAWTSVLGRSKGLIQEYPDSQYKAEGLYWVTIAAAHTEEQDILDAALSQLDTLDPDKSEEARKKIARIPAQD